MRNAIFLYLVTAALVTSEPLLAGPYDLTASNEGDGITRFFVVGDWGGLPFRPFETPSEVAIAGAMGKLGKELNTTFQLALGDNFYFDGVQTANDPRFEVRSS